MKILQVHNRYQLAGGEDVVVAAERALLQSHGHEVEAFEVNNQQLHGWAGQWQAATSVVYSARQRRLLEARLRRVRPELVHIHNFFPLLSPSIHYACRAAGVPVVQTLHNYRLLCPNALFFRSGQPCEDCLGKAVPWPGVVHACYRHSRLASASVAAMLAVHRACRTWERRVARFIVLTEFARDRFVAAGWRPERLAVKPLFVEPAPPSGSGDGNYALYVGRLSAEKGVETLLAAWRECGTRLPLRIVGDGPLAPVVSAAVRDLPGVRWLGQRSREDVLALMGEATFLVFPSLCYETFGLAIAEAFAAGTPVLASNLGAMATLVDHGRTGLLFTPGDSAALTAQVDWVLAHPAEWQQLRRNVRAEFEARYTAERNYETLMEIYRQAL